MPPELDRDPMPLVRPVGRPTRTGMHRGYGGRCRLPTACDSLRTAFASARRNIKTTLANTLAGNQIPVEDGTSGLYGIRTRYPLCRSAPSIDWGDRSQKLRLLGGFPETFRQGRFLRSDFTSL